MNISSTLIFFGFIVIATAAPWPPDIPLCSTDCSITGSPKFAYETGKTYLYSYFGRSQVHLKGVEGGTTENSWRTEVHLTWLSPCDMAISIQKPYVDGTPGPPDTTSIERYPLVVAITDGHIHHVCSHADEDAWSLNLKKGVASALQNSLPTLSPVGSDLSFIEVDVVGSCPTKYVGEANIEAFVVRKEKIHRQCQKHYLTQSEVPVAWLKAPLPVEESRSFCTQEISNKIYKSVTCVDKKILRPFYGSYKYIEAHQESSLVFQSDSVDPPPSVINLRGPLLQKSLLYDYQTPKKDPSLVQQLDDIMRQLCNNSVEAVHYESAELTSKAIEIMKQVPDATFPETLNKIRKGQFCAEFETLESLFLDTLAFVHESGAVKMMVDEIGHGDVSGYRNLLYIAALHQIPRPSIQVVGKLKDIFIKSSAMPQTSLAAASVVNTYCGINPHCKNETVVKEILEILGDSIESSCVRTGDDESQQAALVNLKVLGNLGVIDSHYARVVIRCMERVDAESNVRIAAAQAFRNTECLKEATTQLSSIAVDTNIDTEVRIASYLEAIRCADEEDVERMINKITTERGTQVRGFILSHLMNIQKDNLPRKNEGLRDTLADYLLPTNYSVDFRKYSSNNDLSYYSSTFESGVNLESNVIYGTRSYIPRYLDFNLTTFIKGTPLNLGEFGARIKGVEPILEDLFGPNGYFRKSSFRKVMHDISVLSKQKGRKIFEEFKNVIRQRRSIDMSTIIGFFEKLYGATKTKMPQFDIFARLMGQEMFYSSIKGNLYDIDVDGHIDVIFDMVRELIDKMKNVNMETARVSQLKLDYSLPTIQGIPFKLDIESLAIFALKFQGGLDLPQIFLQSRHTEGSLNIKPELSATIKSFIGYDSFITKGGVKLKSNAYNAEGASFTVKVSGKGELEIGLDFPARSDLINIASEVYLMKVIRGGPEEKIIPSSIRDVRVQRQSCFNQLETTFGLKICYDVNIPNILLSEGLPLGQKSAVILFLSKANPSMTGYKMKTNMENAHGHKLTKIAMMICEDSKRTNTMATVEYQRGHNFQKIIAGVETQRMNTEFGMNLMKHHEHEMEVEVLARYETPHANLTHAMRVNIKTNDDIMTKELDVKVYVSPHPGRRLDVLIADWKFLRRIRGLTAGIEVASKTSNILKQYFDFNFESSLDFAIWPRWHSPLEVTIRKFEFHSSVLNQLGVTSYIRKSKETTYVSAFYITRLSHQLVAVDATHVIKRGLEDSFIFNNALTANVSDHVYDIHLDTLSGDINGSIALHVLQYIAKEKISEMEIVLKRGDEAATSKIMLDIPSRMMPIQFDGKLIDTKTGIVIQSVVKHGKHFLLDVNGPISFTASPSMLEFKGDLSAMTLTTGPYKIKFDVKLSQITQFISLDVKDQKMRVISLRWDVDPESERETFFVFGLRVPKVIDNEIYVVITKNHAGIVLNDQLFPGTPSPRRVECYVDLDFANKTLGMDLSWDADRFPNKKLSIDLAASKCPCEPGHTTLNGDISFIGKKYHMELIGIAKGEEDSLQIERGLDFSLVMPSKKNISANMYVRLEQQDSSIKLRTNFVLENLDRKKHNFAAMIHLERLHEPFSYRMVTEAEIVTPRGHVAGIETEAKHVLTSAERIIHMKAKASNQALKSPLLMEVNVQNTRHLSQLRIETESDKRTPILTWDIHSYSEGGIRDVNVVFELVAAVNFLKEFRKLADNGLQGDGHNLAELAAEKDCRPYKYRYSRPSPFTHAVFVSTPSRAMEGQITISPSEYKLSFLPDKEGNMTKYEFELIHSLLPDRPFSEWLCRISHPVMMGNMEAAFRYQQEGKLFKGTLEVDIFPDTADKVTGSIESMKLSENSLKIDASMKTRVLRTRPMLSIVTAFSPQVVGLDVILKKSPTSRKPFSLALKYDQTSEQNAALSFLIISEGMLAAEVSGSVKTKDDSDCNGMDVRIHSNIPILGKYAIQTDVCNPGFIQVTTHLMGNDTQIYKAAAGFRNSRHFEISLDDYKEEIEKKPMLLLQSELANPRLVAFDVAYDHQRISSVMDIARANIKKIDASVRQWFVRIYNYLKREATQKHIIFPPKKVAALCNEGVQEWKRIYKDLVTDGIVLRYKAFIRLLQSPFVKSLETKVKWAWSHITWLQDTLERHLVDEVNQWEREFKGAVDIVIEDMKEATGFIENGTMPKVIESFLKSLEDTYVYQEMKIEMDKFAKSYPAEFRGFHHIIENIRDTLSKDITKLRKELLELSSTQIILNWMKHNTGHWTRWEARRIVSQAIKALTFFSAESEKNSLRISVPLSRQMHSLSQVAQKVTPIDLFWNVVSTYFITIPDPLNGLLWDFYNFMPKEVLDVIPPYNRTAMVVGDTELLTFDGVLLHIPRSPCQVLLASYLLNELTMDHPEDEKPPRFILTVSGTTAVVRPDTTVTINGRLVKQRDYTEGKITVSRRYWMVKVSGPFFVLRVSRATRMASLEISGWAFGRVAGLMGTYDGEAGNDWMMPSGAEATSVQQLVSSWQENQACETPNIDHVDPPLAKRLRCNAMLYTRSRCSAIIEPDPFVKICYAGKSACDAAKAYRTICSEKGVTTLAPLGC